MTLSKFLVIRTVAIFRVFSDKLAILNYVEFVDVHLIVFS